MKWNELKSAWIPSNGIDVYFLETISEYLNVTYEIMNCNLKWGSKLENGTWDGIVGNIITGEADIGLSGATITTRRNKVIDFSLPYMFESIQFITSSSNGSFPTLSIFKPYQTPVWIAIAIC